jgi:mono/diheme cytochrome c family protein
MLPRKSRFLVCLFFIFIFLMNAPQLFSHETGSKKTQENLSSQSEPISGHGIRRVEHEDKTRGNQGLFDSGVSGICPQARNTPQAPIAFQGLTNPLDPTKKNLRAGETLFKIDAQPTACKVCHGFGGDGLGIIFERLQPKPRNFTCYYTMEGVSDGQIFWIIKNGSPGTPMPSFGALSDEQVWQLVLYIRQFIQE